MKAESELSTLNNLAERYEGFGLSVKKVMEKKNTIKGIIGVVSDIIQVDEKYETAVEIALGGNIQNIVTDTSATAKKLVAVSYTHLDVYKRQHLQYVWLIIKMF